MKLDSRAGDCHLLTGRFQSAFPVGKPRGGVGFRAVIRNALGGENLGGEKLKRHKETRQVLDNIGAVLAEAGMGFSDVVQVQVFLKDIRHYSLVNEIYAEYFKEGFPARAALQVARLPKDVLVEIMATAVRSAGE